MFQKVLIPLDGSEPAEYALEYLASLQVEQVLLLRVSGLALMAQYSGFVLPDTALEEDRDACLDSLKQSRTKAGGVPAELEYRSGEAAEQILRVAEEQGCDLILMTSHGRSGFSRFVMGSVAERVLRHASCPVLIVGREAFRHSDREHPQAISSAAPTRDPETG